MFSSLFVALFAIAYSATNALELQKIVKLVNANEQLSWKAEINRFATWTQDELKTLMGVNDRTNRNNLPEKTFAVEELKNLPTQFDARQNWPNCPTIEQIRDQSACGACWAFSSTEAMSDRYCTFNVHRNLSISSQMMNSCCQSCGNGCGGGSITEPWVYWMKNGLVSTSCEPYSLPSCDHHVPHSSNPCPSMEYPTPACHPFGSCAAQGEQWVLHRGYKPQVITSGEDAIMAEIMQNGPVQTAFTVFEDFLTYKNGVYVHKHGAPLGGHAVKFIGWGVENGVKYWTVSNSWNKSWGLGGTFRIIRGVNECGIEDMVSFGVPLH